MDLERIERAVQNEARNFYDRIAVGKENAVRRPNNPQIDRAFRRMVEEAQGKGRIIINTGEGYFEPNWSDEDEVLSYRHYINAKKSRVKAMAKTINAMERTAGKVDQMTMEEIYED